MSTTSRRARVAVAMAAALTTALTACSSGNDAAGNQPAGMTGTADAVDAALKAGGEITYWSWTPSAQAQVDAFMKEYPQVKVNYVNAGTNKDQYTKLQNAIKAGSGAPDVAQVEYQALPQFAMTDSLLDLGQFGFNDYEKDYTASTWNSVKVGGGLFGLPQDSGPMAMFYNKEVFDQYQIQVPKTWDEYVAAAEKLNAADPTKFITADSGDAGFATSMVWQAGGKPFTVDGTNVKVNLQDEGAKKWTETWNKLVSKKLTAPTITGWSDEWYRGLGNGSIVTMINGAWMPGILESSVPDGKGKWAVAPMPTYDGKPATAENGGGGQSVIKQSANPALAAGFVRWLNHEQGGIDKFIEFGGFPATTKELESDAFLNAESEYFGGQKINQVLSQAGKDVVKGWQYLPFQLYANSIFNDNAGSAYANATDLNAGLTSWQNAIVEYGNQQGFTVTTG
ncbi:MULTISPECIES: sugar ABC transporter substrate-binding protein [Actinosynnema]|uniref:ABC transporter substrate-binding protein n=1 Tax=Actinosynnema TaxID=40566 RepID=UPI0020A4FD8F|nr:sugar ABC transporter substrate-binding protein [Actinosynnema pretiosum]